MGDSAAALTDFGTALAKNPALREAHYNRAVLLLRSGRTADARADIEAFMRLGGRPSEAVLALVGLAQQPGIRDP
jgi:Flp pilus assembly protein TadD